MITFGSAIADAPRGADAAESAAREAAASLKGTPAALAVVFASAGYADLDEVPAAVARVVGDAPVVGGTCGGCIIGPNGILDRGVSVALMGGDGLEARAQSGQIRTPALVEAVPIAARVAEMGDEAAKRGLTELTCLAFAPGVGVDGAALVAAVRKGAGARAQLAGGLTGDDLTFDRPRVFCEGGVHKDRFVVTGLFTRAPLGVVARHGLRPAGPTHQITRSEDSWLVSLDGKPAIDVWLADAIAAGATPPAARGKELALYLANHFALGLVDGDREPVVRASFDVRADGAVLLSASVPERTHAARVVHATQPQMLAASRDAARDAARAAGGHLAGALVFACTGRLAALDGHFAEEAASIARELRVPIGGSCVFGEIARARRDVEAFYNTTAVVVAIPA